MSSRSVVATDPPKEGELVLVWDATYHRFGLRSLHNRVDWYDENEDFDDSEIEFLYWWPLPFKEVT